MEEFDALGRCYGLDHQPISFFEAALLLGDSRRHIAADDVDGTTVSTVFLPVDLGHGRTPVPLLYETMVTDPAGDILLIERHPTREAAIAGHDRALAWVRNPVTARP